MNLAVVDLSAGLDLHGRRGGLLALALIGGMLLALAGLALAMYLWSFGAFWPITISGWRSRRCRG